MHFDQPIVSSSGDITCGTSESFDLACSQNIGGNYRPVGFLIVYVTIHCPPIRHLGGTWA